MYAISRKLLLRTPLCNNSFRLEFENKYLSILKNNQYTIMNHTFSSSNRKRPSSSTNPLSSHGMA